MNLSQTLTFAEILRDLEALERTLLAQAESKKPVFQAQNTLYQKKELRNYPTLSWSKFEVLIVP